MKFKPLLLPILIILAGILFSIFLQTQVSEGVYLSGDAGLKALLAKQLGAGTFRFDLVPPKETWVQELWRSGLYPYDKPYVYNLADKYYITFPFTFPLITAPFEAVFGFRGLYFVPLISTWVIWFIFYIFCRSLNLKSFEISIALIALIFASPLTIYSAMYWEHSLAVCLALAGTMFFLKANPQKEIAIVQLLIGGVLIGLSVWFRPEFLCWVVIFIGLIYAFSLLQVMPIDQKEKKVSFKKVFFLSKFDRLFVFSAIATIGLFFFLNQLIYNHPLGIHSIQVVEKISFGQKLKDVMTSFLQLGRAFFVYFPLAFLLITYPLLRAIKRRKYKPEIELVVIYLICFFFLVGVSFIVPPGTAGQIPGGKQWGARFLLFLIPIVILVVIKDLAEIKKLFPAFSGVVKLLVFSAFLITGIHLNTYQATVFLQKTDRETSPAVQFLQKTPNRAIAVSHQFVAQALEASTSRDKWFFLVENKKQLEQISQALRSQKQEKFIYICYPHRDCNLPKESLKNIKFSKLGIYGKYPIYEIFNS
jgi:hypothetical protein